MRRCVRVCVRASMRMRTCVCVHALLIRASAYVSYTKFWSGVPRGDFSCKFAYKIDVNFYKTIIATIPVTIMLTKPRGGAGTWCGTAVDRFRDAWLEERALPFASRASLLRAISEPSLIGKDHRGRSSREISCPSLREFTHTRRNSVPRVYYPIAIYPPRRMLSFHVESKSAISKLCVIIRHESRCTVSAYVRTPSRHHRDLHSCICNLRR